MRTVRLSFFLSQLLPPRLNGESMYLIGGPSAVGGLDNNDPKGDAWVNTHKLNERAVAVVQRIQTKLTGRDFSDSPGALSVSDQVPIFFFLPASKKLELNILLGFKCCLQ